MATHGFKVIDSDGKETSYKNYDAWLASENAANKIANKIIEDNTKKADQPSENNPLGYDAATSELKKSGDTPGAFNKKQTKTAAEGADKTLDQVAGEYAENKFTPTGVWEYDLGYALGRARKKKIDAAGGKEAFKSAKRQKRSETAMRTVGKLQSVSGVGDYGKDKKQQRKQSRAIAKEKKSFTPISKMQTIQPNKQQLRKIFGQIGSKTMTNQTEVKGLPKKSNPYKPF